MELLQQQFFSLLQAGLWGKEPNIFLFNYPTDWKQLYVKSKEQCVAGIMLDGIQHLPTDKRPPRALYLEWCNLLMQMEENNQKLNREIAALYDLFRKNGIEPVLVKGQGIAQNYRNPLHRQCGDIDLYVGETHFETANELLMQEATAKLEETYKHAGMMWHGVEVENHRILINLSAPMADKKLQREIARWRNDLSLCPKLNIDGTMVNIPPTAFNVAYILLHVVSHFLNEGIGMRHVCDWCCLLQKLNNEERNASAQLIKDFGLERAARVLGVILTEQLGLPPKYLVFPPQEADRKKAVWLLNDIWIGGNFGKYNPQGKKRPKGYWSKKWQTFKQIVKRCIQMGSLAPSEARWQPIRVTQNMLQVQWKKLSKQ